MTPRTKRTLTRWAAAFALSVIAHFIMDAPMWRGVPAGVAFMWAGMLVSPDRSDDG